MWYRVFSTLPDDTPPADLLAHLEERGLIVRGDFRGDDLGWSSAELRYGPGGPVWLERWLAAHGRPPDAAAALMADAIRVLAEAVVRSGGFSPQRVRDELRRDGAVWSGLAGPLRFDSSQSCHRTCFALRWNGSAWKTQARLEVEGN